MAATSFGRAVCLALFSVTLASCGDSPGGGSGVRIEKSAVEGPQSRAFYEGRAWAPAWDDDVIAEVTEAEFHNPAENRLVLTFASRPARYVRLQLMSADDVWYWSISELEVWSGSS